MLLPTEILDRVAILGKSLRIALIFRSRYATKVIVQHGADANRHPGDLLEGLCGGMNTGELLFLARQGLSYISIDHILISIVHTADNPAYLQQMMIMFKARKGSLPLDGLFTAAISKGRLSIVRMLSEKTSYIPRTISNSSWHALTHYPDVYEYLVCNFPGHLFECQESLDAAIESDNVAVLEMLERVHGMSIRESFRRRDLTLAATRGSTGVLRWVHQLCRCSSKNFTTCILPETLFNTAANHNRNDIVRFLQVETNSLIHRRYHPRFRDYYDSGASHWFRQ